MSDYSTLTHQLKLLDDKVYNHFVPDNKVLCNCDDNAITMFFEEDIEAIMMRGFSMKEIKDEIKSAISNMNIDREALTSFIEENIHFDKIEKAVNIRKDFDSALKNVEHGYELSGALGYGFSKEDIENLAKLHKAGKHKEKIEDLLEDCNFHTECDDFSSGRYSRYIWEDNDDEPIVVAENHGTASTSGTKESFKVDTSAGSLVAVAGSYDGSAKGVKISVNGNIVAIIDVTDNGEIRLLGYKEDRDEPSLYYSVNR